MYLVYHRITVTAAFRPPLIAHHCTIRLIKSLAASQPNSKTSRVGPCLSDAWQHFPNTHFLKALAAGSLDELAKSYKSGSEIHLVAPLVYFLFKAASV